VEFFLSPVPEPEESASEVATGPRWDRSVAETLDARCKLQHPANIAINIAKNPARQLNRDISYSEQSKVCRNHSMTICKLRTRPGR